jgi:hypothetical protein
MVHHPLPCVQSPIYHPQQVSIFIKKEKNERRCTICPNTFTWCYFAFHKNPYTNSRILSVPTQRNQLGCIVHPLCLDRAFLLHSAASAVSSYWLPAAAALVNPSPCSKPNNSTRIIIFSQQQPGGGLVIYPPFSISIRSSTAALFVTIEICISVVDQHPPISYIYPHDVTFYLMMWIILR